MLSSNEMVAKMAQTLAGVDANLGDERACIRALQVAKFQFADIVTWVDQARIEANNLRALGNRRAPVVP